MRCFALMVGTCEHGSYSGTRGSQTERSRTGNEQERVRQQQVGRRAQRAHGNRLERHAQTVPLGFKTFAQLKIRRHSAVRCARRFRQLSLNRWGLRYRRAMVSDACRPGAHGKRINDSEHQVVSLPERCAHKRGYRDGSANEQCDALGASSAHQFLRSASFSFRYLTCS